MRGSFDEALENCLELAERGTHVLVNSLNPDRIEGQKTAAFEIDEELGRAPDVLALPYGGGGNTVAYAKGFAEDGVRPRMISAHAIERATTMASAIRIAAPAHLAEVESLVADGTVEPVPVSDEDITRMWAELARGEGIFCEPSSAAGLAALAAMDLEPGSTVVCVLTGHGLKDTAAVELLSADVGVVDATVESILGGGAGMKPERFVVRAPATIGQPRARVRLRGRRARPLERAARRARRLRRAVRRARGRGRRRAARRREPPGSPGLRPRRFPSSASASGS